MATWEEWQPEGLINIFPNLSDISGKQRIFGLNQEIIDRMKARNAAFSPDQKDWGTTDRRIVDYYLDANMGWFYVRKDPNISSRKECTIPLSWILRY